MAKGLIHGATLLLSTGVLILLFAVFSPMWLVLRSELGTNICWFGQGIWVSQYWWGSDLDKANFICEDENSGLTAHDEYCNGPDTAYNRDMCTATRRTKQAMLVAIVFQCASVLVFFFLRKQTKSLLQNYLLTAFCNAVSITASFAGMLIMLSSPLYGSEHIGVLSKLHNTGPIALKLFSCALQSILRMHPQTLLPASAPNECLFPGPSVLGMLIYYITQGVSLGFVLMLAKMEWRTARQDGAWRSSSSNAARAAAVAEEESEEKRDVLPSTFHKVRKYSMHGAMARRYAKLGPMRKFLLLTAMPILLMMGNAASWLAYILLGVQIMVNAKIRIMPNSKLQDFVGGAHHFNHATLQLDNALLTDYFPALSHVLVNATTDHDYPLSTARSLAQLPNVEIFDDVVNAFNFSPMTSIYFFWTTGAYLICIGMFGAIFALPIIKVVAWIWMFFTPFSEIQRGRVLMFLDAIGKYSLANLYLLILITASLGFRSNFIVLPISPSQSFVVQVSSGINAGNGIGSYMYVITSIMSLSIGQFMVQMHSMCSSWEEDRRSKESGTGLLASPLSVGTPFSMDNTPMLAPIPPTRLVGVNSDEIVTTATVAAAAAAAAAASDTSRLTSPLLRTNLRASFVDLSNLARAHGGGGSGNGNRNVGFGHRSSFRSGTTSDNGSARNMRESWASRSEGMDVESQQQPLQQQPLQQQQTSREEHVPDIVRALAKYGSRAALQVLAKKSAANTPTSSQPRLSSLREERKRMSAQQRSQLHPHVEAMCDRIHSPEQGIQLKITPAGKIFIWFLVFFVSGIMLVCQSVPLFEVHRYGLVGDLVVKPKDRYQSYSLLSLTSAIADMGFEAPALELSTLFFLMTAVMPLLTAWGLAMLWGIPLTLRQQEMLFNFLELASAWSSLDIFFLSIFIIYIEVQNTTASIINAAVPNTGELVKIFLPFEDGVLNSSFQLEFGFWILVCAVIAEKFAILVLTENAVQAISERRAEQFLKDLLKQQQQGEQSPLVDSRMLVNAAEGLLESDAILAFAPAGRYFSAMFPHSVYAGLPRGWWVKYGVWSGMLADARAVTLYDLTGRTFEDELAEEDQEEENEDEDDEFGGEEAYRVVSRPYSTASSRAANAATGGAAASRGRVASRNVYDDFDSGENEIHYEHAVRQSPSSVDSDRGPGSRRGSGVYEEEDTGPISF